MRSAVVTRLEFYKRGLSRGCIAAKCWTDVESVPVATVSRINLESMSPDLLPTERLVWVNRECGREL